MVYVGTKKLFLKICNLAVWWHHTLDPNFDQLSDEQRRKIFLPTSISIWFFCSKILLSVCVSQYKPNSFVTMAPYWVLDLSNIKDFSAFHFDDASYAWSSPGGLLPIMAYMERLCPKGVPFSGFMYIEG